MACPIIVFSHLRWDYVFQRPQHVLSRLARHHPIVFVEEPLHDENRSFLKTYSPAPNVLVCQPHTPVRAPGFHDDHLPYLRKQMRQLGRDHPGHIAWFYTPMALPLMQELDPGLVVYDCMDDLSTFRNAPRQLHQRESALMKVADLVFTGGPSLYRAKRERHPNVHCFPSSVDARHFEQALDRANSHPLHRDIPGPRLGYYGVIDERLDLELLRSVADAHPRWQIVLVGPVAKIDPASLPRRSNIHYMGMQPYEALPRFLAGWDVCLLPFARNEATRWISPTKTLEYMAAELPVVSTPVPDVVEYYGDIVRVADDAPSFVAACEQALLANEEARAALTEKMRTVLAGTCWDATVVKMRTLIQSTPRRSGKVPLVEGMQAVPEEMPAINRLRTQETARPPRPVATAIIGAGPTGLSAAYHLGNDTVLLERNDRVGGWCRSIRENGFTFDHAGHIMFSEDPAVHELYRVLLGDNVHWQEREAWVFSKNTYTRYPFQGALHGLPPEVIRECIMGAIEARYGALATAAPHEASATIGDCCADGGVSLPDAKVRALDRAVSPADQPHPANFEEFIYRVWGAGIARHFAIPYNRKLWGLPLSEMETSWLGGRVPLPDLEQIIDGALRPPPKPMGPNARFGYPKRGGFQALVDGFLPHIRGSIELNADVVHLAPRQRLITLADGRSFQYEQLIATMPLPELVRCIGDEAPEDVRRAAQGLRHVSVRCVNLGVARERVTDKHWIYYPEDTVFHRVFAQGNASPECNPPGGFGLTCEISYSTQWKPLPLSGRDLIDRCVQDCIRVGLLRPDDRILAANEVDMPYAYVVYDHQRARNVEIIKAWLARHRIILAGRYAEWEYYNSDHAFIAGQKAAQAVTWEEPQRSTALE